MSLVLHRISSDITCALLIFELFFFFKQKTAYDLRISDWSSDVCSSDLTRMPASPSEPYPLIRNQIRPALGAISAGPSPRRISAAGRDPRSEERRVRKEWVSTCRSRGSP